VAAGFYAEQLKIDTEQATPVRLGLLTGVNRLLSDTFPRMPAVSVRLADTTARKSSGAFQVNQLVAMGVSIGFFVSLALCFVCGVIPAIDVNGTGRASGVQPVHARAPPSTL
jgi:hypothetical protein